MSNLYYTPPEDKIFDEVKLMSMELWHEIDSDNDKYGYASSKIDVIKDIDNAGDNLMFMVAMFDIYNQDRLAQKLTMDARIAIRERMLDGGMSNDYIHF